MKVTNWGNYPVIDAVVHEPRTTDDVRRIVAEERELIPRGLGRCYGDSSLNHTILSTRHLDHFIAFDSSTGLLTCEAGVSFADIVEAMVPRGWFLPVTPGTKFVTVGGAVASDVHGKNHHVAGSLSSHIASLKLLLASGEVRTVTPEGEPELFWATCGGMGLTGVILEAAIRMKRIETAYIRQRIVKNRNIDEAVEAFERNAEWTYSVAWIDCLAKGEHLGRSALILGEHATQAEVGFRYRDPLSAERPLSVAVPFMFPGFALNTLTVKAFNALRYATYRNGDSFVEYEPFFYPLDGIRSWNRIYGRRGFTQYQFVVPRNGAAALLRRILSRIAESGEGSFLAVLKLFGRQEGMLSFPMEGYTLALDFAMTPEALRLFTELDTLVTENGGRLYLTKDVRMNRETFERGYAKAARFKEVKRSVDPHGKFLSLQSRRVGIL